MSAYFNRADVIPPGEACIVQALDGRWNFGPVQYMRQMQKLAHGKYESAVAAAIAAGDGDSPANPVVPTH